MLLSCPASVALIRRAMWQPLLPWRGHRRALARTCAAGFRFAQQDITSRDHSEHRTLRWTSPRLLAGSPGGSPAMPGASARHHRGPVQQEG